MIRLLTAFFAAIDKLLGLFRDSRLREEGRQQSIKEANDEINRQVELAEHVAATPDPERDERLRDRFDRSRGKRLLPDRAADSLR